MKQPPKSIEWVGDINGYVSLLDQTKLPEKVEFIECHDVETIYEAIQSLRVRGAPAIGIAAAMGLALGVRDFRSADPSEMLNEIDRVAGYLKTSRPTAVNLSWALERMQNHARSQSACEVNTIKRALVLEAQEVRDEDERMCREIGEVGQELIKPNSGVLTICNAGALATAAYGTALAAMYAAHERDRPFRAYACETRPLLQGARLTTWELQMAGIDVTLLCDGMIGALMKTGKVDLVITGADRIAANGDSANKIGTYSLAVLAKAHQIPFYIAAPTSTFDLSISCGDEIPIEFRSGEEIRNGFGVRTAPKEVPCFSPAFDVTPAELISGLITQRGMVEPVTEEKIASVIGG